MLIAVVGDTHGHIKEIQAALEGLKLDGMLFTGDFLSDGRRLGKRLSLPFYGVAGNCDRGSEDIQERLLDVEGHRIFIVHGHQYGVKHGLLKLCYRAAELEAEAVLFGHTHMPMAEEIDGIWLVNPGSPSNPRGGSLPSYALLEIEEGAIRAFIRHL